MKSIISKTAFKKSILLAATISCSQTAISEDLFASGFTLTPSVGYHGHSGKKQGLGASATTSLSAGYQFDSPWATELTYLMSEPEARFGSSKLDEEQLRLDALYYFDREGKAFPYTVFGVGETSIETGGLSDDTTIVNAGVGIKYAFNNIASLRTDLRAINYLDNETTQAAFNIGLSFLLGGKTSPSKTVNNTDSDADGVVNRLDSCPGTKSGIKVDATGCPIKLDSDRDGVPDSDDACPDSEAGAKVQANGCYQMLKEAKTVTLQLQFANNAADVLNPNDSQIVSLAEFMRQYPEAQVIIGGHTDDRGSAAYNQQLSQKRAQAVADVLTQTYKIKSNRITAKGFGETSPIADNTSAEGRAKNRRVEATVNATVERVIK